MIRNGLILCGIVVGLAACSPSRYPGPEGQESSATAINISGTAVAGVAGGSEQTTQMVSGIKDLEMSVGLSLGSP